MHVKLELRITLRRVGPLANTITVRRTGQTETLQYMLLIINSLYLEWLVSSYLEAWLRNGGAALAAPAAPAPAALSFDPLTASNFGGAQPPLIKKWGGSSPPCPPRFSASGLLSVSESASTGPLPCLGEWVSE